MGFGTLLHNPGNFLTPYELTLSSPDATPKLVELLLAMRSSEGEVGRKSLADLVNTTSWAKCDATGRGWTVALSNSTAAIDDSANGGVGSGARVDGTTAGVPADTAGIMLKRIRISRSALLDSLRGWERVFVRSRATAVSKWEVELRWGASLADPPPESNTPPASHEVTAGTTVFGYVEMDLGHVRVPEEGSLGGVALELWARRVSGTGDLHLNLVRLFPATPGKDVLTRIVVPGGSSETWLGSDLVTPTNPAGLSAGTVSGTALVLDAANEAGGTPPNSGLVWPVGFHRVAFHLDPASNGTLDYTYRVRNITDSDNAVSQSVVDQPGTLDIIRLLEFSSVSGKAYQAQVIMDGGATAIGIKKIEHTFIPTLGQNEQAHSEPDNGIVHKRDSSGNLLSALVTEGEIPLWVPSGLAGVFIIPLDVALSGHALHASVKARTISVSPSGSPRTIG